MRWFIRRQRRFYFADRKYVREEAKGDVDTPATRSKYSHRKRFRFATRCTGNAETVKQAIEAGVDIQERGGSALRKASFEGFTDVVRVLLGAGADPHAFHGEPLRSALTQRHYDVAHLLLDAKASPGQYEMHVTCVRGETALVRRLIEAGADVRANNNDAIRMACKYSHEETVRLLLEARADPNAVHTSRDHILTTACRYGYTGLFNMLLEYKADPHAHQALYQACKGGHESIVRRLLEEKVDPNNQSLWCCPIEAATKCSSSSSSRAVFALLLEAKADPLRGDFAAVCGNGDTHGMRAMMDAKVDIHVDRGAAIQSAASCGRIEVMRALIEAKADPLTASAFDESVRSDKAKMARFLLDAAPRGTYDLNSAMSEAIRCGAQRVICLLLDITGNTSSVDFTAACRKGHADVVMKLLDFGADPGQGDNAALVSAITYSKNTLFRRLLDAKVDVNTPRGRTPLTVAGECQQTDMMKELLEAKADVNLGGDFLASSMYHYEEYHEIWDILIANGYTPRDRSDPCSPGVMRILHPTNTNAGRFFWLRMNLLRPDIALPDEWFQWRDALVDIMKQCLPSHFPMVLYNEIFLF